jgi:hypothetical protein
VVSELSDETKYTAALAEQIYRRAAADQALEVGGIGLPGTDVDLGPSPPTGLTTVAPGAPDDGTYYYDDKTGFVGRVVQNAGTVYVVFRGTDLGSVPGNFDVLDWASANIPLALGTQSTAFTFSLDKTTNLAVPTISVEDTGNAAETQFDDALRLTLAAMKAAPGQRIVLVGQSLGGGLASLVSAVLGLQAYVFAPAPFANELTDIAALAASHDNPLDNPLGGGSGSTTDGSGDTGSNPTTGGSGDTGSTPTTGGSGDTSSNPTGSGSGDSNPDPGSGTGNSELSQEEKIAAEKAKVLSILQDNLTGSGTASFTIDGEALSGGPIGATIAVGATSFDIPLTKFDLGVPSPTPSESISLRIIYSDPHALLTLNGIQRFGEIVFHQRAERINTPPITMAPSMITGWLRCTHHGWKRSGKNANGNTTQITPYIVSICTMRSLRRIAPTIARDMPTKNNAPAVAQSNSNRPLGASNRADRTAARNASTPPAPIASKRNSLILLEIMTAMTQHSYTTERHQTNRSLVKGVLTGPDAQQVGPMGGNGSMNRRVSPPVSPPGRTQLEAAGG